MSTPRVSVVMSVFSDRRFVREAIDSVLGQTYGDFEFIIVDDASTDESLDIIRSYGDPRVRVVENAQNMGLTRSLNIGLGNARGEYIARIDSDDVSMERRLEMQVAFLDAHPDVGMVGSQDKRIDESGAEVDYREKPTRHEDLRRIMFTGLNPFRHSSALFRRVCIAAVGAYRAELRMAQDYDLWLRIVEVAEVANIAEPLCKYRVRADSMTYAKQQRQMDDAAWAHRLAIQRQIFGRDELGYEPAVEPFESLRRELRRGFVSRRAALSDRYLLCGREYPFRQGRLHRSLSVRYIVQSLVNNPLNAEAWRYMFHKSSAKAKRRLSGSNDTRRPPAKTAAKDD